jgi:hypothetical protein
MSLDGPHVLRSAPRSATGGPLARRLFVLSCFSPKSPALTAEQIVAQIQLSPRTVEALAENLVRVGCLDLDRSGAYWLAGVSPGLEVIDER